MSNKMEKNYQTAMEKRSSLAESIDSLRVSIRDLYELDEDNYQIGLALKKRVEDLESRLDRANAAIRRSRRRTVLGFIGVGGLLYVGFKGIEALNEYVRGKKDENSPEETDESDG